MPAKGRVWSCPRQSDIADVAGLAGRRIALKGPAFQLLALYALLDEAGRRLVNIYTTPIGQLNSTIWASPRMVAEEPELVRAAVAMQRDAANHLTPGGTNDPEVWRDLVVNQFALGGTHLPRAHHQHRGGVGALGLLDRPGQGGRGQDGRAWPPAGRARLRRPHPHRVPAGLRVLPA
ncbi:MAG: hypothetical protein M3507_10965 [Actinomycetota bacterium]|nr:hypothetical protein [Actinomycetota bacterium]